METTLIILTIAIFYFLTSQKLKKMADQNAIIEGYVARISDDTKKIGATLKTVQDELNALPGGNPLTDQTIADMEASVTALDALANLPAPTPTAAP